MRKNVGRGRRGTGARALIDASHKMDLVAGLWYFWDIHRLVLPKIDFLSLAREQLEYGDEFQWVTSQHTPTLCSAVNFYLLLHRREEKIELVYSYKPLVWDKYGQSCLQFFDLFLFGHQRKLQKGCSFIVGKDKILFYGKVFLAYGLGFPLHLLQ